MIASLAILMNRTADVNKMLKICAMAMSGMKRCLEKNNRLIAAASVVCFAAGLALSHRFEPGVRVQNVTLAEDTPALNKFPMDNVSFIDWKLTICRQGDQLTGQESTLKDKIFAAFKIYPESETNFLFKAPRSAIFRLAVSDSPEELSFIKNDRGEVTSTFLSRRGQGLPDSEGKKLKHE